MRGADAFDAKVTIVASGEDATLRDGTISAQDKPDDKLVNILQAANADVRSAAALRDAGLDAQQAQSALRPPPLRVVTVEPVDDDADERGGFAFFAVLLLYGQLIGIGYFVAMGVVEEKSSRVVELLLSTLKPKHLLAGKILGLGLLGLGQLLLLAVLGLGVAAAGGALDVDGDILIAAGLALVWFVVGYAFYAAAFATRGVARLAPGGPAVRDHAAHARAAGRLLHVVRRRRRPRRDAGQGLVLHPAGRAADDAAADRARARRARSRSSARSR